MYPQPTAALLAYAKEGHHEEQECLQRVRLQRVGLVGNCNNLLQPASTCSGRRNMLGPFAPTKYLVLTDVAFPRDKNENRAWLETAGAVKNVLANVSFHDKQAISKHLPDGTAPSLVVVFHIHPGTKGLNRTWIETAKENNMTPPQYAIYKIAKYWPSSAILGQVRSHTIHREHPEFNNFGFSYCPPDWPSVNGFAYTPKRNDGSLLGAQGDVILYRPSPVNPFHIADGERPDLQQLFRHFAALEPASGKQPLILMYSTFDFDAAKAIHMLITSKAD